MAIAERLKEARLKAGLSQEQVSDLLHVSRQLVSKWESGASEPKASELVQCARIYETTIQWLCECAPEPVSEAAPESATDTAPRPETLPCEEQLLEEPQPEKTVEGKLSQFQRVIAGLAAAALIMAVFLTALPFHSTQQKEMLPSLTNPFADTSIPVWNQDDVPAVSFAPEDIQNASMAAKEAEKRDTYETKQFDINIAPGDVYLLTDFLKLAAGSVCTFQAQYVPTASSVCYGVMNRELQACVALELQGQFQGRIQISEDGEYCLYIQNRSEDEIHIQGYYTYSVCDEEDFFRPD